MTAENNIVVEELIKLLNGGTAHVSFPDAIDKLPAKLRGVKPDGLPYTIWQLVEHIRIAQWDMLQFCKDAGHQSPKWPDDYWVKETCPENENAWETSIEQIKNDLTEFIGLLGKENIYKTITHGESQNILREALQIADHTSYHTGEIITLRRILKDW